MALESELVEAKKLYDFVRFTFTDIHGIGRCKVVAASGFDKFFRNGVQFSVGSVGFGLKGEGEACDAVTSAQKSTNYDSHCNLLALPVPGTLHALRTVGEQNYRIGEILCETFHPRSLDRQQECPRYIARKQLERLRALGYELYSSFEIEFQLVDAVTLKPVFQNVGQMFTCDNETRFEPVLVDMAKQLEKSGVQVETMQSEYSEGQFELTLRPQLDIRMADELFLAKNCIKDVAARHSMKAIFMTVSGDVNNPIAMHFNHSLRRVAVADDGPVHAFYDANDDLRLSETFRRWMAGLIGHYRAMHAVCCPTVNCYRRLEKACALKRAGWGIDKRRQPFRVKNFSSAETYVESRLPTGPANPYLVMAATVAAGIDGLLSQLPCPPPAEEDATCGDLYEDVPLCQTPQNMGEALRAMQDDGYLVDALGKDFVKWFVMLKESEMRFINGDDSINNEDVERLAKEINIYFDML